MKTKLLWIAVVGAALALAGCGGGGGDDADELSAVPDSAVASPEEFTRWVGDRESSESRAPLAMNSALPPISETAEPIDID
jgi:ABC-type glycerol-3-phosphate transport system substrate-binding protein